MACRGMLKRYLWVSTCSQTEEQSIHFSCSHHPTSLAAHAPLRRFTPSKKVAAKCVGPSVSIALVPKVCILDSKSKQVGWGGCVGL